jgi:hypothetical protein
VAQASSAKATLTLPGWDSLGLSYRVAGPTLVVGRADGQASMSSADFVAAQPVLAIDLGPGGSDWLPPVDQWRASSFPAWSGGAAAIRRLFPSGAPVDASYPAPQPLSEAAPFFARVTPAQGGVLSGGHGLEALHP